MSRLPPHPDLDWKPDGTPVARGFDDVYFSTSDGLAEARAVFLAGCGLPEAWAGRAQFTVAETGFGTGLNFLALWQMWRAHRPSRNAWLHFVSFEAFPLEREDAARALAAWPELAEFAAALLEKWPHRARGIRRLVWPEDGLTLTLHIDDIAAALPKARFAADAWFLDGFSPARNGAMWNDALYPQLASHSAANARLATFTVAGGVRRGLSASGFKVRKCPGFGRKRERLEADFAGAPDTAPDLFALSSPGQPPQRIAILGAGIAGASLARALYRYGADVTVFDTAAQPAAGASGNPAALIMPRLDAADTAQARIMIDAYITARAACAGSANAALTQVRHAPRQDSEFARFAKILADPPLPLEDLEALSGGGLLHKGAVIVRPAGIIAEWLSDVRLVLGAPVDIDTIRRRVNGQVFDAIVLANGIALNEVAPWLGMVGRLGQVDYAHGLPDAPASAVVAGDYALNIGDLRLWGATFEDAGTHSPVISPEASEANRAALEQLSPWWRPQIREVEHAARASIRATTPDFLPVAGPLPDFTANVDALGGLRHGQSVRARAILMDGVWIMGGLGSRGFTFAPWLAEIIVAQMMGQPAPAARDQLEAISPMRIIHRGLKRGLIEP